MSASCIILEYYVGNDSEARLQEIRDAADRLGYAYYLASTETRKAQATYTVVIPVSQAIKQKQYARIASVLATQMNVYRAAPGIQAYTHLIHVSPHSVVEYHGGLVLNPEFFIKITKNEAQGFSHTQFEKHTPAVAVQLEKPINTACDEGLFEGL